MFVFYQNKITYFSFLKLTLILKPEAKTWIPYYPKSRSQNVWEKEKNEKIWSLLNNERVNQHRIGSTQFVNW